MIRSFLKCTVGSTAVELAFVLPLLLAFMTSVLEFGWYLFTESSIHEATQRVSRSIRIGQLTSANTNKTKLLETFCGYTVSVADCKKNTTISISSFNSLASLDKSALQYIYANDQRSKVNKLPHNTGDAGSYIRIQVNYLYKPISPVLGLAFNVTDEGFVQMSSIFYARNEPFGGG